VPATVRKFVEEGQRGLVRYLSSHSVRVRERRGANRGAAPPCSTSKETSLSAQMVFSRSRHMWSDHVGNIAIELHDATCETVFFTALSRYRYDLSRAGELTVCRNISRIV
jgi:hypothetical protein